MGKYTIEAHLANLKRDIDQAKRTGLRLNAKIIGSKCCLECDKIDQLTIPFEDILNNPVLPYEKCIRHPFCICCYGFETVKA